MRMECAFRVFAASRQGRRSGGQNAALNYHAPGNRFLFLAPQGDRHPGANHSVSHCAHGVHMVGDSHMIHSDSLAN